jgi:hypothetical protein
MECKAALLVEAKTGDERKPIPKTTSAFQRRSFTSATPAGAFGRRRTPAFSIRSVQAPVLLAEMALVNPWPTANAASGPQPDEVSQILSSSNADLQGATAASARESSISAAVESELLTTAQIVQSGNYNSALIDQTGARNHAVIMQSGNNAAASIIQSGTGNNAMIVQH